MQPSRHPIARFRHVTHVGILGLLGACAHGPEQQAAHDPAEPTNRVVFGGNMFIDRNAVRPVARTYVRYVPPGARRSVHSFVQNLGEPITFVNDLAQGNLARSWNTSKRFVINTTVGGLGLFDVASGWGMPYHKADFGQTFGVWGIPGGPEMQLPLLGFANVRDAVGQAIGMAANPLNLFGAGVDVQALNGAKTGFGVVDGRAGLLPVTDDVDRSSLDRYATLRSMTEQNRLAFIRQGKLGKVHPAADPAAAPKLAVVPATTHLQART